MRLFVITGTCGAGKSTMRDSLGEILDPEKKLSIPLGREDLLLTTDEGEASYVMRRAMNGMKGDDAVERILDMFARTRSNEELIQRIKHSHVI